MRKHLYITLSIIGCILALPATAQDYYVTNSSSDLASAPPVTQSYSQLMPGVYPAILINGDTVACIMLRDFIKYSPLKFTSDKQRIQYDKMLRDVKKTLPYAKEIALIIRETYEYMETLPDEKARQKHLEKMEKYLFDTYKPKMSKLTRSQGQMLIKLVDRETNSSSYRIVDAFMGSFKAFTYNVFAGVFGNSLKKRYDPYGEDKLVERAAVLVEMGAV